MGSMAFDFIGNMGLGGVFLGTIIEALGIPFPGGVMLLFAGVLISRGSLTYLPTLLLAVAGFNLGAVVAYIIGRTIGDQFFNRFKGIFKVDPEKLNQARQMMEKSSAVFILAGRFIPMISNLTPYLAGMSGLKSGRFLFYNTIFAVSWATFNIVLGYYFSQSWQLIMKVTGKHLTIFALLTILLYFGVLILLRRRKV